AAAADHDGTADHNGTANHIGTPPAHGVQPSAHDVMPKVLFRLGLALAQRDRWREAADELAALARAEPDFENLAEAELARGRALAHVGDPRGARAAFDRVIAKDKGRLSDLARIEIGRLLV